MCDIWYKHLIFLIFLITDFEEFFYTCSFMFHAIVKFFSTKSEFKAYKDGKQKENLVTEERLVCFYTVFFL